METIEKTEARAILKSVRMKAQNARLVIDLIRGKKVLEAQGILKNTNREASRLIKKVLDSAVANAEHNLNLDKEKLYVKECFIDDGKVLKRIKFGSRGHIDKRDHRTSHITVVVAEK